VASGIGAVALVIPILFVVLLTRACGSASDWNFSALVDRVEVDSVCLKLAGDGPATWNEDASSAPTSSDSRTTSHPGTAWNWFR
jgi:hypothetical protein